MKKAMLLALMAVMLTSCGAANNTNSSENTAVAATVSTTAATTEAAETTTTATETTTNTIATTTTKATTAKSKKTKKDVYTIVGPMLRANYNNVWKITDKTKIKKIDSIIKILNNIKDKYVVDKSKHQPRDTDGYIIQTNGEVYNDIYFLTTAGDDQVNFSRAQNDYKVPQKYVDELVKLVQKPI